MIITNTSDRTVTLNQPTSTYYDIGALSTTKIIAGSMATFTVQPKEGLSVGEYPETISITGSKGVSAQVSVSFTVTSPAGKVTITFDANGGYVSESSITTTGGKLTSMPVAVRYGYTFYTGDGYLVTLNTIFNHNTTLYVGWQVNEIYRPIEPTRPVEPEPDEPEIEWVREDGNTRLYIEGRMVTGWYQDEDGSWYLFDEDSGIMSQNDWAEVDDVWYYFERDGVMQTGWIEYDDNWYYLKDCGGMATGWQYIDGNWYYFRGSGAMVASAWIETNGKWYYLTGSGAMAADRWVEWKGEWYYLYLSGVMATNATIDGYYVNANGVWVE